MGENKSLRLKDSFNALVAGRAAAKCLRACLVPVVGKMNEELLGSLGN